MRASEWLVAAVTQTVVAIQGVVATRAANPNVESRNAIRAVVFVILVVVMVAAATVRVRMAPVLMAAADSVREMVKTATAGGMARFAVPVAIPIVPDA